MRTFILDFGDGQVVKVCIGFVNYGDDGRTYSDSLLISPEFVEAHSDEELVERIRVASSRVAELSRRADELDAIDLERQRLETASWTASRSRTVKASNLYLMKSNGIFKIGIGQSVENRRKALYTASGYDVEIVASWPMPSDEATIQERRWHEFFATKRLTGEWFSLDDDDVKDLCNVMDRER